MSVTLLSPAPLYAHTSKKYRTHLIVRICHSGFGTISQLEWIALSLFEQVKPLAACMGFIFYWDSFLFLGLLILFSGLSELYVFWYYGMPGKICRMISPLAFLVRCACVLCRWICNSISTCATQTWRSHSSGSLSTGHRMSTVRLADTLCLLSCHLRLSTAQLADTLFRGASARSASWLVSYHLHLSIVRLADILFQGASAQSTLCPISYRGWTPPIYLRGYIWSAENLFGTFNGGHLKCMCWLIHVRRLSVHN